MPITKNEILENLSTTLNQESIDSLKKTAKKTVAKTIKTVTDKGNLSENEIKGLKSAASQSIIPVKDIKNGFVITDDNRYIGYVEVLPINFNKMPNAGKKRVLREFGKYHSTPREKFGYKIISDTNNPDMFVKTIRTNCKHQDDPKVREALNDYIEFIYELSRSKAVVKRYYYIFEYDGLNENVKKTAQNEILQEMEQMRNNFINSIANCGNACIVPDDWNYFTLEFLYRYFNKATAHKEPLETRIQRVYKDFEEYNRVTGSNKKPTIADILGTKGITFANRDFHTMDGYYYAYIGIKGDDWPARVAGGWIDCFDCGINVDIDVIFKQLPDYMTSTFLKLSNRTLQGSIKRKLRRNQNDSAERKTVIFNNNTTVKRHMDAGANLYDAAIILTVRERSPEALQTLVATICNHITTTLGLRYDTSSLFCRQYFTMTMPFLYITSPFKILKHNILSTHIETIYPFVSYQISDPEGFVLGMEAEHYGIMSLNNFNSNKYLNANILLLGSSGAGKTFTEQLIGRRMTLNGMRSFFIVPKKGYEYRPGCEAMNGQFISLYPGSKDCINILDIYPEGEIDASKVGEDISLQTGSLRANKIRQICTWINLLLLQYGEKLDIHEYDALKVILAEVYDAHGITDDNNSIFEDVENKILKDMPILQEVFDKCVKANLQKVVHVLRDFVSGTCKNLNGQTNVDLTSNYMVFDIDEDKIGEELLPAFLWIAFNHVYSTIKANPLSKDVVFLDEVWKIMQVEEAAKQVHNMVKLVRGYGGCTVVATQEIADFLKASGDYGESVLSNSLIKIILYMEEKDLVKTDGILNLSREDKDNILSFKRGDALLIAKDDKVPIKIIGTNKEVRLFNTDIDKRIKAS